MTAVNSFPLSNKSTLAPVIETVPLKSLLELATEQLSLLSLNERNILLTTYLSSEFEEICTVEKSKGFDEGLKQAKEELISEHQRREECFKAEHDEKIKKVEDTISSFSNQELKLNIGNDADLVTLIVKAVLQLIGIELNNKDYIKKLIMKLASEYSSQKKLILNLSSHDIEIAKNCSASDRFCLEVDESLSIGDYRLSFEQGQEENSLHTGLIQLVDVFSKSLGERHD